MQCTQLHTIEFPNSLETINAYCFQGDTELRDLRFPAKMQLLGQYCFDGCKQLGTITLPGGAFIRNYAFLNTNLSELNFPDEATTFENSAPLGKQANINSLMLPGWMTIVPNFLFAEWSGLENLILSEGIENIGEGSFRNCGKLTSLNFTQTVKNIGNQAFSGCTCLTEIDFSKVENINNNAFLGCNGLVNIELPESLTLIGNYVFAGCIGLQSVKFHPASTVKSIGDATFKDCKNLSSIQLPVSLEKIGDNTFTMCEKLSSIDFPISLVEIGASSFSSCTSLEEIEFHSGMTIGNSAFSSCGLTNINFPNETLTLGTGVFSYNKQLKCIEIPQWMEIIPEKTFLGCQELETVTFEDGLEKIGDNAFEANNMLHDLKFPSTLKQIGKAAFKNCNLNQTVVVEEETKKLNFGKITLPAEILIDDDAFNGATVNEIEMPDSVTFGKNVFCCNRALTTISLPQWMTNVPEGFLKGAVHLENVNFSEGLKQISDYAFYQTTCLRNVVFPNSLTYIGKNAFYQSGTLSPFLGNVVLPAGIFVDDNAFAKSGVTGISFEGDGEFGNNCFLNLDKIEKFGFPATMEEITNGFCNSWKQLKSVVLPANCKKIGDNTFNTCTKLTSVTYSGYATDEEISENPNLMAFPETLLEIGNSAFANSGITSVPWSGQPIKLGAYAYSATAITEVTIPNNISIIPDYCFNNCSKLQHLEWEERLNTTSNDTISIGQKAFNQCVALENISFPETFVKLGTYCFYGCKSIADIAWNNEGVVLADGAFSGCSSISHLDIPDYIREIPEACFANTTGLSFAQLGKNVKKIGKSAFSGSGLQEVLWPDVLEELGQYSFYGTKFRQLNTPKNIENINLGTFQNLSLCEKLTIGEGTKNLQYGCFTDCSKVKELNLPESLEYIGVSAFSGLGKYSVEPVVVSFSEGLKKMDQQAFQYSKVKDLILPKSLENISWKVFYECKALESVLIKSDNLTIGNEAFKGWESLKHFQTEGEITSIGIKCFNNDINLEEFLYPEHLAIGNIGGDAFANCISLKSFPKLSDAALGSGAFRNCSSLKQLVMPFDGSFYNKKENTTNSFEYLNGASSLESIIFPFQGKIFNLQARDIADAPLRALSYSLAKNIKGDGSKTIVDYI